MHRKNAIIFLVLGILFISITFFYLLPNKDKTFLNYISLVGNFLALWGLILAYLQIVSLKELSQETKSAVLRATEQLQKVLSIAELSKSKKLIEEIQQYLHNNNLVGALIRIKDLKETLIQIKYNKDLERFTLSKAYKTIISNTAIDINSINDSLLKKIDDDIDKPLIIKNLEQTKSYFLEFENELKFKNNG